MHTLGDMAKALNRSAVYVHGVQARFDYLLNRPETDSIGTKVHATMRDIECANPDKLFGIFANAQWTNKHGLSDAMLCDLIDDHLQGVPRAYQDFKDEPGFTRIVPIEDNRAKEGSLNITLYIGAETRAQIDAAAESATTSLPDVHTAWIKQSN